MGQQRKTKSAPSELAQALGRIPSGMFVLTAHYEDQLDAIMVSWIQQVSFEPPMVMVSLHKGRSITPLICGSNHFGLCQVSQADKLMMRRFEIGMDQDDPFQLLTLAHNTTSVPIIESSLTYMECEVVRHLDIEADHEIFIGKVVQSKILRSEEPRVHLREDGLKY